MAQIRYPIRLYSIHDLDLVTFTLTHDFDILKAVYSSLTAFTKGEAFIIRIPPAVRELPELRRVYTKTLSLDTEKDAEAVELLNKIVPGKRNNFLKNLLRLYLAYPFSECFFSDPGDQEEFEKKMEGIRAGRRVVRAGKKGNDAEHGGKRELSSLSGKQGKAAPAEKTRQEDTADPPPADGMDGKETGSVPAEAGDGASPAPEEDAILALFDSL